MRTNMRRRLGAAATALVALAVTGIGIHTADAGTTVGGRTAENGRTAGASTTEITSLTYDLGPKAFTDLPEWEGPSEVKAIVRYPRQAAGKLPVVVLLHGQQLACHSADENDWDSWPCPRGVKPYPSFRGYDYLADALAKDGFAVVSISANGLNFHMGVAPQRARLINRHLALLQQRRDLRDRLDFTRVGTMGHSVGGEGVMYQAAYGNRKELPAGVRIRGVVSVASPPPSGFYDTRVTTAPIAVFSAGCWSLGNEKYFQEGVHGFRIRVTKGNHNYYNTEWTRGPGPGDGDDTDCPATTGRPSAAQQQDLAVHYLRAFYRYTLKGDSAAKKTLTSPFPGVDTELASF
ncbi:hypothetical protein [Actinoplanes couchii]|uniref:PET hydrolase/cutinase-like domain-containing protein n=1 Tax=Actinoplanes couchii TaxID=403638 RepID=A0ABQ3XT05_9ACTN|nr:hypothetical protein [Actinoplanes couchii]MDR6319966.1 dienelactone hydrolase [Actinoplanes couchii]GID61652.1 hypothetical protein Aco03nite_100560 [Actinoplanes couchii]